MDIDLSPVVPQARIAVGEAAEIFAHHLDSHLIGLLIHGSALKGGFIPGGSDIDFQLYLDDAAFEAGDRIPLPCAIAIHRDLAAIDVAPFQYIQCYARPARSGPDERSSMGPVPGTYHMLIGTLPVPEATPDQVLERSRHRLETLDPLPFDLSTRLLHHGTGQLERTVRLLCTDVWPTLYSILALRESDPLAVWRRAKDEAIACLPADESVGREIRAFYRLACRYYHEESMEGALAVIAQGVRFLRAAGEWWAA